MSAGGQNIPVTFSVKGIGEVKSSFEEVKAGAKSMTDSIIESSLKETKAGEDILKVIRERIKLEEERRKKEIAEGRDRDRERGKYWDLVQELEEKKKGKVSWVYNGKKYYSESGIEERNKNIDSKIEEANKEHKKQEEFYKEQQRQSKLQTEYAQELVDTFEKKSDENRKALNDGNSRLEDVLEGKTSEEKLVSKLTEDKLTADNNKNKKSLFDRDTPLGVGALIGKDVLQQTLGGLSGIAQTNNGFDVIAQTKRTIWGAVGSVFGAVAGGLLTETPMGAMGGAALGNSLLSSIGGGLGELDQKGALLKQDYLRNRGRTQAIMGGTYNSDFEGADLSGIGVNHNDFLRLLQEYARRRGYGAGAGKTLTDALYLEKGYGVDQGTLPILIEMLRSSKGNNRDLAGLIGGVLEKGKDTYFKNGDTTFLNEFMQKFAQLQKELLNHQTTVSTGTTYDVLSKFNSVGGEFATSDPRSMGLISTINNSLANPDSDFKKALSFHTLHQLYPKMGNADITEEMQKGVGSSKYMYAMMKTVDGMYSDDDTKRIQFASLLGLEGNQKAASNIFYGFKSGKLNANTNEDELSSYIPLKTKAENNTSPIDKTQAELTNSFLAGQASTQTISNAISEAFKNLNIQAVVNVNEKTGVITFQSTEKVKQNLGKTVEKQQEFKKLSDEAVLKSVL